MKLSPVKHAKYARWFGKSGYFEISLEFRPNLDKWDVVFIDSKYLNRTYWYMHKKVERFSTMQEALVFIMKQFDNTVELQDRFTFEVTKHSLEDFEMKSKAVETITLVYGKDSRLVTEDEIFDHIKNLESEIKSLNAINTKPVKLQKRIGALEKDIKDLVKVVDGRE